jgi:hypothetical protein
LRDSNIISPHDLHVITDRTVEAGYDRRMLFLLLISFLSASHDPDENEENNERPLRDQFNKFAAHNARIRLASTSLSSLTIQSVNPRKSPTEGGVTILLSVNGLQSSTTHFCRFDTIIVEGTILPNNFLKCLSPKHASGEIPLAVSFDEVSWSADVPFFYVNRRNTADFILAVLLGLSIVSFAIFVFQRRQWRNSKRKHRKMPAALIDRHLSNLEQDIGSLKRQTSPLL